MENRSQDNSNRRHRGNRSGGRSRNRQGNSNSGGHNRSRNRNRSGSRSKKSAKPSAWQKFLSVISFGLLGKPKSRTKSKRSGGGSKTASAASRSSSASTSVRSGGEAAGKPRRNRAEVTSPRLYVGNLDYSTGEPELEQLFRGVGNVLGAEVVTNPKTQQSKGFAFVEMGSLEEAKRAVSVLDDQDFMGRRLVVSGARGDDSNEEETEGTAMAGSAS